MGQVLRTEEEIRAAGAAISAAWPSPDERTVEAVAAILGPVAHMAYGPVGEHPAEPAASSKAA